MKTSSFAAALILPTALSTLSILSHAGEQDFSFAAPASTSNQVTRDILRAEYFSAVSNGTQLLAGERNYAARTVAVPVLPNA